jgi:hypothetical protein
MVGIGPVTEAGYSLIGASSFLEGMKPLPIPHYVFWDTMAYFLNKDNKKFRSDYKKALNKKKR